MAVTDRSKNAHYVVRAYPPEKNGAVTYYLRITAAGQTALLTFGANRCGSQESALAEAHRVSAQISAMPYEKRYAWAVEWRRVNGVGWNNHKLGRHAFVGKKKASHPMLSEEKYQTKYPRVYFDGQERGQAWLFWPHGHVKQRGSIRFPISVYGFDAAFELANAWGRLWYESSPAGRKKVFERMLNEYDQLRSFHLSRSKGGSGMAQDTAQNRWKKANPAKMDEYRRRYRERQKIKGKTSE